ncbi:MULTISPECIES: NADH:flavin oxidoreductase/NADH oxidase [Sutcliffiella]|uniref:NADPH dehydrogenase n=1 Tax=Sutcliffiella cohnii TaxID=33932 RepID=A0A223KNJ6_9BACI|nr:MULTISPECIES: NADH:flavin oxidoreductase/NADH oxidase [Sutcliffiella]AST91019.1 NADPH dehydrogenase [Sutcliffiella cohnii]WBL16815.1 NADH:flavin oxidoreductase/NADH oxidase [Sutcliffiella sp. NC1]
MAGLFSSFSHKGLQLKNRIMMSSMCQYQAENKDGTPTDWHFVHYVSRAIGGTGLIFLEMTNVELRGRITNQCLTLHSEYQVPYFKRIVEECHKYGSKIGIQIAHAGRKSVIEGSDVVGPGKHPFSKESPVPRELTTDEVKEICEKFGESAALAVEAGFDTIEIHGAHGYLLHQFMSPATNHRTDQYGEYHVFPVEVIREIRSRIPSEMPLILRISAVEYGENGYNFNHMLKLIPHFIEAGVDIFDVSTGGNDPVRPDVYPAYQAQYAQVIKERFKLPVITVGRLESPYVAESIIREGRADIVAVGRGLLREPYWAKEAAIQLNQELTLPGVYDLGYSL